jgi:hypothetical protein
MQHSKKPGQVCVLLRKTDTPRDPVCILCDAECVIIFQPDLYIVQVIPTGILVKCGENFFLSIFTAAPL